MKQISTAMLLVASMFVCCSESQGQGLLNRMMSKGGCGSCASSCCDTPADACAPAADCCRRSLITINFNRGMAGGCCGLMNGGGLFGRGCGGGCDACAPAPAPAPCAADPCGSSCGCRLLSGGLLSGMFNRNAGCGGCGDCGSGCAPAPAAAPCCDAPANDCCDPCGRSGRLRGLMSRIRNINLFNRCDDGCNPCAPEPAPCAQADPCDSCCGGGLNLMGRMRGMLANRGCGGCGADACGGCEAAPACEPDPCGCGRSGLLDRLRGRMASRGCCDPCNTCDSGCGGSGADATPTQATPAEDAMPTADPANKVDGGAASLAPIVDPSAFSIRGRTLDSLN